MEANGTTGGESSERSSGDRRNASMPHGGKLLSGEQSLRLAIMDSVDRDTLIAHIVERLRAEQRAKDSWPLQQYNRKRQQREAR